MNPLTSALYVVAQLLYRAVLLWFCLLLLLYLGYKLAERSYAIDALPAPLEVDGLVLVDLSRLKASRYARYIAPYLPPQATDAA